MDLACGIPPAIFGVWCVQMPFVVLSCHLAGLAKLVEMLACIINED